MADHYGYSGGYVLVACEDAYGDGGLGDTSNALYIAEGGDGLVRTVERQDRTGIGGRSRTGIYDINAACGGTLELEAVNWYNFGRFLYSALGGFEGDLNGPPNDVYYYCAETGGALNPTLALTIGRGGWEYPYVGCMVNSMTLSQSGGDVLRCSMDILGKSEGTIDTSPSTPTYSAWAPVKKSQCTQTQVAGTDIALGLVRDFTLTINNNLRADGWPLGIAGRAQPKRVGRMSVTGSIVLDWDDNVDTGSAGLLDKWRDETTGVTLFKWGQGSSITETELVIYLPSSVVDGDPVVANNGAGIITATINFSAIDASVSAGDANLGQIVSGSANAAYTNQPIVIRLSNNENTAPWQTL